MPEKQVIEKAKQDLRVGKSPTTAAGEFVHEEIDHVREGKHGARSAKQAIAIGLSKARRAGIPLPPPKKGTASAKTRSAAMRERATGQAKSHKAVSQRRSRAATEALEREGRSAASPLALSRQAKRSAARRKHSR